jgi:hypothetical protein
MTELLRVKAYGARQKLRSYEGEKLRRTYR